MKSFRDTAQREWAIVVDLPAISRVMKAGLEYMGEPIKVNILALVEPHSALLKKAVEYPPLVGGIVYALCEPQCVEKNVNAESFAAALNGDVLEAAFDAILEETVCFFPQERRTLLMRILEKSRTFAAKTKELRKAKLDTGILDRALDEQFNKEMAKLLGDPPPTNGIGSVGNSSGSSDAIPASATSEN